ncbi:MAG: FAD-dependent oxidoreductase [Kiritimatiellae bacterium]|jgi:flavin-dependent dehydrogenase|nr:FAD-dependent oxidoreductase [Kiritimatiellia bacterium]
MKKIIYILLFIVSACLLEASDIVQSEREIPIVRECDVLVVGGSCAAVNAALSAREAGASVFLVAPRTYLGDDVAATRELWQSYVSEADSAENFNLIFERDTSIAYSYNYLDFAGLELSPDSAHPDSNSSCLTDGVHDDAVNHSVQFNESVVVNADLNDNISVSTINVYYYRRDPSSSNPFGTVVSAVDFSNDGINWTTASISNNIEVLGSGENVLYVDRISLIGEVTGHYFRVQCDLEDGASRQLLDEVEFLPTVSDIADVCYETKPLRVKQVLDSLVEDAGIPFIGGSHVCDILEDGDGNPAGVILINKRGRQAVRAKVIVDATEQALPARLAGAAKRTFTPGEYSFSRIVMSDLNDPPSASGMSVEMISNIFFSVSVTGVSAPAGMLSSINGRVWRCTFTTNLVDGSATELLEVEQIARDLTWVPSCFDQADNVFWIPPDSIIGKNPDSSTNWIDAASVAEGAFRPAGVTNIFVLGPRTDVSRDMVAEMLHPARMMALGERIGALAAGEALAREDLSGVVIPSEVSSGTDSGEIFEDLDGFMPAYTNAQGNLHESIADIPVIDECEVLIIGAGTSGGPAAISAGRAGADTVVVEFLYNMGGVAVDGRIGRYYYGNDCGFTANDIDPGAAATGSIRVMSKPEWTRRTAREAGVRILFGTMAVGALVDEDDLKGVIVALPDGTRGVILAQTVVDATGRALIADLSGEETEYITASELALQGAGLAPHYFGSSYNNTDVGFVDPGEVSDVFFFARRAHASMNADAVWDTGQNPATRERRRLVGVVSLTPIDILNNRTWPDTICRTVSNFDSHGFTVHDVFFMLEPTRTVLSVNLPYRVLLPKRLENLLCVGLGMSAHRDAMPVIRMQRDVQNQGYAAGYASALAVQSEVSVRNIDIDTLQSHLVSKGIISSATAAAEDSFPITASQIQGAVDGLTNSYANIQVVFADIPTALPMLRTAYENCSDFDGKLIYAHMLGMLYDDTGVQTLADAVESGFWDTGWNYTGMGQYGSSVSLMDSYIIALGRTHSPAAVSPVLAKIQQLNSTSYFSHIRACSFAVEQLRSSSLKTALSQLLTLLRDNTLDDGMVAPAIPSYSNTAADAERNRCLKEISAARALYVAGDDSSKSGEATLKDWLADPRLTYAEHVQMVFNAVWPLLDSDGVWISDASSAIYAAGTNWLNSTIGYGVESTVWFTNHLSSTQSISLDGRDVELGRLVLANGERVFNLDGGSLTFKELDGYVGFTGDGNVSVVLNPELDNQLDGTIYVSGGVFEISIPVSQSSLSVDVPYSSFESDPLLPYSTDRSAMDKRGDAAESGCAGWNFVDSGSVESGYQRNNSYFSSESAAQTSDGVQTAFVRQSGTMSTVINVQTAGVYNLSYSQCPRGYTGTWYNNHTLRVKVDDVLKHETIVSNHWFTTENVDLGYLAAGSHALLFEGEVTVGTTDPCTLIDSLEIIGVSEDFDTTTLSADHLHLEVDEPGQIALNYNGVIKVGSLVINGLFIGSGIVDATTYPELFTGDGQLLIMRLGTLLMIR